MWQRQFASDARKAFEARAATNQGTDAQAAQSQAIPIKTAIAATIITASDAASMVIELFASLVMRANLLVAGQLPTQPDWKSNGMGAP